MDGVLMGAGAGVGIGALRGGEIPQTEHANHPSGRYKPPRAEDANHPSGRCKPPRAEEASNLSGRCKPPNIPRFQDSKNRIQEEKHVFEFSLNLCFKAGECYGGFWLIFSQYFQQEKILIIGKQRKTKKRKVLAGNLVF